MFMITDGPIPCRHLYWHFKAYGLRDAPTGIIFNNCKLCPHCICHHHHHHLHHLHHHISVMELGHLLTRSGLTCPEVSSKICRDSFCQSGSTVSLPWVIYYEAFYLHVVSSFSCIPVVCPSLLLFLTLRSLCICFVICPSVSCIYLFYLRTNSDLCHLHHKLIGFLTEMKSVYSAVRTGSWNKAVCASSLKG
jgi:hypothetical protein